MIRAILIALSGLLYFMISIPMMMPLRMMKEPIVNYNLFYGPFLVIVLGFLFYRCCTAKEETKAYLYGFFAAIFAWQLFGELASMPVEKGVIPQFSDVNIKAVGGYFYLAGAWLALKILWRTGAIKNSAAVFFLTFLCIWTFELYMDNYSTRVPLETMPLVGRVIGGISLAASVLLLIIAKKSQSKETQTVMGCLLYITLSIGLMGFFQWTKPSTFYVKYEGSHIEKQIEELEAEKRELEELKRYMIANDMLKEDEKSD